MRYLAGCDGGGSRVRELLQIALDGTPRVALRFMVHFRSTARHVLQRWGIAWHYQSPFGTLIAQNDDDIWTLHARPAADAAPEHLDPVELLTTFCGASFEHEILVANAWTPHLLLAQSYGRRRVFLAGDAAHQYIPTGGYGMNTGIADAVDLGWKLAATLLRFGGPELLQSYETERRPVGLRNREASAGHTKVRLAIAECYRNAFGSGPSIGDARRAELSAAIAGLGNAENESMGIEFGYVYDGSPIVASEAGAVPPSDPLRYVPTTMPGARLPSTFLQDGSALFDRLGPWFTLVNFGAMDVSPLVSAAETRSRALAGAFAAGARARRCLRSRRISRPARSAHCVAGIGSDGGRWREDPLPCARLGACAMSLKVIIIGGGIGGTAAAHALLRIGCEVRIYEQVKCENRSRGRDPDQPERVTAVMALRARRGFEAAGRAAGGTRSSTMGRWCDAFA